MQFDDDEDFADDDVDMEVVASSFCACNDAWLFILFVTF